MGAHPWSIPRQPQSQDSVTDQLRRLIVWADRLGLYDAADYLESVTRHVMEKDPDASKPCRHCGACYYTHQLGCPALSPEVRSALPGGVEEGKVPASLQAETGTTSQGEDSPGREDASPKR